MKVYGEPVRGRFGGQSNPLQRGAAALGLCAATTPAKNHCKMIYDIFFGSWDLSEPLCHHKSEEILANSDIDRTSKI